LKLKAAIAGCGGVAQVHAAALASMPGAEIIGAADPIFERACLLSERYGGQAYKSVDDMLGAQRPDVLHICAPHGVHAQIALQALDIGVNVLCEKPPAISFAELDEIKAAVVPGGPQLGFCLQNRYNASAKKAMKLINSGKSGAALGARAFVTWSRGAEYYTGSGWRGKWASEGGGVMINQAIHTLDLMLLFMSDPVSFEGSVKNRHLKGVIETEDTAELYLDFGGGKTGLFYATTAYTEDSPVILEIQCENYVIVLSGDNLSLRGHDGTVTEIPLTHPTPTGKTYWGASHGILIGDFYRCVADGSPFPIGIDEASRALKVILELYRDRPAVARPGV